jgi:hypothetical protein
MNYEIYEGDRVIANYGAMYPTVEGEVTKCNDDGTYTIMFDDGAVRNVNEIKLAGQRSVNGSPIGIFLVE